MHLNQQLTEHAHWVEHSLHTDYADLFDKHTSLNEQIRSQIEEWQYSQRRDLLLRNPFAEYQSKLARKQQNTLINQVDIDEYQNFCHLAGVPFDKKFWQEQLNKAERAKGNKRHLPLKLLLKNWQQQLDKAQAEWYLMQLEQLRKAFLGKLRAHLEILQKLGNRLAALGFDAGLWLDNSIGQLKERDIQEMQRWLGYLSTDKAAKQIAELLGKMRQIAQSEKIEQVKQTVYIKSPQIDINSKEEIIGLRLGKDLEYVLPSELALMSDEATAILFDLKFLESKLMCFELQGSRYRDVPVEIETEQSVKEDEKQGPMILCVDTSGSMQGIPENIAKAMALFLATKAKRQNRACFIINFSTTIETFEITDKSGVADLVAFLRRSFHGGTDVAPALNHALTMMEQQNYQKADVLIISDFIMNTLSQELLDKIAVQRKSGNQFNSLVVGNQFMDKRLKTHFDHEWVYNPSQQKITELVQFQKNIRV